jgi:small subunit ribosomal protein S6
MVFCDKNLENLRRSRIFEVFLINAPARRILNTLVRVLRCFSLVLCGTRFHNYNHRSSMNSGRMYESVFIINAALEDSAIDALTTALQEFLQKNGASIQTVDKWGRRRLAYPIRKKHNGYYIYYLYEAPAALQPALERYVFLEENIVRFLTVKMTPQGLEFRKNFLENRAERVLPVGPDRVAAEAAAAAAKKAAEAAAAQETAA